MESRLVPVACVYTGEVSTIQRYGLEGSAVHTCQIVHTYIPYLTIKARFI